MACLAFRAMGKDLNNRTTEAIKTYMAHCRNFSFRDLAKLGIMRRYPYPMTAALISQDELGDIKNRELNCSQEKAWIGKEKGIYKKQVNDR